MREYVMARKPIARKTLTRERHSEYSCASMLQEEKKRKTYARDKTKHKNMVNIMR